MAKKKKVRVDLRKNRAKPPRKHDLTRDFQKHGFEDEATTSAERVRAKGDLSRRRTIIQDAGGEELESCMPAVDPSQSLRGRVLRVHGLWSVVEDDDGKLYRCVVRRLLKQLLTEQRNIITTGDVVWLRPAKSRTSDSLPEGLIERVEPRHGVLTRASRGREHVLVANVDQLVIVVSLVEPELKPHLIDRYIATAVSGGLAPIICLNKADLVDAELLQPLIGAYSQLGVATMLTSAVTGQGLDRLRNMLAGRETVFSGQSGVGKSSLLNSLQPGLDLRVREVSEVNQKGTHTTTTAELIRLEAGGWVVDTPGLRQLRLWDIQPAVVEGFFAEFRPYVSLCEFPDCWHVHENGCAVKRAVFRRQISDRRYVSYRGMIETDA
jgi:ribosome biogenesis GTPase